MDSRGERERVDERLREVIGSGRERSRGAESISHIPFLGWWWCGLQRVLMSDGPGRCIAAFLTFLSASVFEGWCLLSS
ncbi:hypothetical protein P154DRAFT_361668 [Amniculicola lignicola CBS 123094]|uniref:Uncharacterized protein n=1 Tax=Amniculicola lignicola CBS 123094 TaxID=1392246 RepID=A0A6A5W151_9PLEO|nr:hypothetical protein P154DRAFT_361668 [Amniculicola lignicola CBS 123094]